MTHVKLFAILIVASAVATSSCHATPQARDGSGGSNCIVSPATGPVIVLANGGPGAVIPGSIPPSFVLYADGVVVYLDKVDSGYGYVTARLSPCEVVALVGLVDSKTRASLNGQQYTANSSTDQNVVTLMVWRSDGSRALASVYGWYDDWQSTWRGPADLAPPPELDGAIRTLDQFSRPDAVQYEPPAFRVYDGGDGYLPTKPIGEWPRSWPDLSLAKPIGFGPWRAMNIGGLSTEAVRSLLGVSNLHFWCCVKVGGGRTAVMYRPVFPQETLWSREIGLTADVVPLSPTAPN